MRFNATFPEGLKDQCVQEIKIFGGEIISTSNRIIFFSGDMQCLYRICLRGRIPFKISREIARFPCEDRKSLYYAVQKSVNWGEWLPCHETFKIDVTGKTGSLNHSHFTALEVKNAIIDYQHKLWRDRSDVSIECPDLSISLHLHDGYDVLSLQADSKSFHKRGNKVFIGEAPVKENLASGLIQITGWDFKMPLIDLMCGSGTFLIESALIAKNIASNINRNFCFKNWIDYDQSSFLFEKNLAIKAERVLKPKPIIIGCEINKEIYVGLKANIVNAGLQNDISIFNEDFMSFQPPNRKGIAIVNPPYGVRIGNTSYLEDLYRNIGIYARSNLSGWDLWVLSGNPELTRFLKLRSNQKHAISSGGINCRWVKYKIN